jgi:hypothetical protein
LTFANVLAQKIRHMSGLASERAAAMQLPPRIRFNV